jgi:hypothetical protein
MGDLCVNVTAEVEASDLFEGENVNWRYCLRHATFQHKDETACEFILHIGSDLMWDGDSPPYWQSTVEEMRQFGCSESFVGAYLAAKEIGAVRVLFYA